MAQLKRQIVPLGTAMPCRPPKLNEKVPNRMQPQGPGPPSWSEGPPTGEDDPSRPAPAARH